MSRVGTLKCSRCRTLVRIAPLVIESESGRRTVLKKQGLACGCLVHQPDDACSRRDRMPEEWRPAFETASD